MTCIERMGTLCINENYVILMMNFITYCVIISTDTEMFNTNPFRKCLGKYKYYIK